MKRAVKIGTRGSRLALWQANFVQASLRELGVEASLEIIKTKGDKIQHLSFDKIEGKGFFTKEIEDALLAGQIDMAVHSMKDLPTNQPDGLVITAVSERATPADWLIVHKERVDTGQILKVKEGGIVGTSSARRKAQMVHFRPDISLQDIRGNVPTRLKKLEDGQFDAILLAAAGLTRLEIDLSAFEVVKFNPREFIPAPAQGVLAYQCRKDDLEIRRLLRQIHHGPTASLTNVERKVLQLMDGGCHLPLGVYCERDKAGNYHVWGAMADGWDQPIRQFKLSSSTSYQLAEKVFEGLK